MIQALSSVGSDEQFPMCTQGNVVS